MRRILFLIPNLGHGGAEHVLVNLVNNLTRDKYEITVKVLFDEGVYKSFLARDINYKYVWKHQFRGFTTLLSLVPSKWLFKYIVKEKYDVVVSYLEGSTSKIVSGCNDDTKKVCWVHIELGDPDKLKVGFRTFHWAVKAYKNADKVVFVAESVKRCFENTAGCSFKNSVVLYNTNETEQIIQKSRERVTDVVFAKDVVNVCSVAKIMSSKGYDRLVRVHKRLMDEGVRHHVYILGIGEQKQELERYLQENNLTESFTFLGYRENPYKYVSSCDLYVCSSRREGFSTSVTEALIVGTPVVSTNCSGATELLGEHNEYGIVVENSEEGIYQGMKQLLLDGELRKHYAEKALERGRKFSREETVKAVEDMLDNL